MGIWLPVKFAAYVTVTCLLIFWCPNMRGSHAHNGDITSEELSSHQEYDPNSVHYYYDAEM